MTVQLAVATFVHTVFINVPANMEARARRINMCLLFTNRKLPSIHSESVPRSTSKTSTYSYAEIKKKLKHILNRKRNVAQKIELSILLTFIQ